MNTRSGPTTSLVRTILCVGSALFVTLAPAPVVGEPKSEIASSESHSLQYCIRRRVLELAVVDSIWKYHELAVQEALAGLRAGTGSGQDNSALHDAIRFLELVTPISSGTMKHFGRDVSEELERPFRHWQEWFRHNRVLLLYDPNTGVIALPEAEERRQLGWPSPYELVPPPTADSQEVDPKTCRVKGPGGYPLVVPLGWRG